MRLGKYLKVAFTNRWNLLAFLGGMAFSLISGRPDIFAPVVLAGELTFLGLLATHPKFQHSVDAAQARKLRKPEAARQVNPQQTAARILTNLPRDSARRFEELRSRTAELRQLAMEMRDPSRVGAPPPLESLQLAGLDRLLWIYLRLLYTEYALRRFLQTADVSEIERDIESTKERLAKVPADAKDARHDKLRRVLTEHLATSTERLENYRRARDNCEYVQLELQSLDNKIRSLGELAINRQDPAFISGQVDQVVSGMVQTEQTMSELQFLTGLESADDEVPELAERTVTQTAE